MRCLACLPCRRCGALSVAGLIVNPPPVAVVVLLSLSSLPTASLHYYNSPWMPAVDIGLVHHSTYMSLTHARLCGEWRLVSGNYEARGASGGKYEAQIVIFCTLDAVKRFSRNSWTAESQWRKQKAIEENWKSIEENWKAVKERRKLWKKIGKPLKKIDFRVRKIRF